MEKPGDMDTTPRVDIEQVERKIDYHFSDPRLLVEALTTPAFAKKFNVPSYERLEFLGDAVIKIIISTALYAFQPSKGQDVMTREFNILGSNKVLATRALQFGIHEHARSLVPIQSTDAGVVSDLLEATCGAMYLDSGMNLEIVKEKLVDGILADRELIIGESPDHFKNQFIEAVQRIFGFTPVIEMDYDETGPDHYKRFGARDLKVIHPAHGDVMLRFGGLGTPVIFKQKRDAEKELMKIAFERWREADFST